jgi:SsrA-binding protein
MANSKLSSDPARKVIADNRKARFNYEVISTVEAGIQLTGSEVKALRAGKSSLGESYASDELGELYLINAYFPEYNHANRLNHHPRRPRKLLLHRREIDRLSRAVQTDGMTLVPLKLYFNDRGIAKLELALAKGKRAHDKREASKKRDWQRDKARLMREKG